MPAGNDFCNNQLINASFHNTDSDEGRGIPALGKLVYDLRDSTLYLCTDTAPNATENGGGTWAPVGGAGGSIVGGTWTPTTTQGSYAFTLGSTSTVYYTVPSGASGGFTRGYFRVVLASSGSSGGGVYIETPPYGGYAQPSDLPVGYGYYTHGGGRTFVQFELANLSGRLVFVAKVPGGDVADTLVSTDAIFGQYVLDGTGPNANF